MHIITSAENVIFIKRLVCLKNLVSRIDPEQGLVSDGPSVEWLRFDFREVP